MRGDMPARERRVERGEDNGRRLLADAGRELRLARLQHGLALHPVAGAAGISAATLSRIERGLRRGTPIAGLARIGSVLGLDVSLRLHPAGEPIRDRAHAEVLARLR